MAKTIAEKLNLHKYEKAAVLNLPTGADYLSELQAYDTVLDESAYNLIFVFVVDMDSLKQVVNRVIEKQSLAKNGFLYFAYPKKGNKVYPTFIHRDELFPALNVDEDGYVGTSSLKFARMVGLDDVFTVVGLKEAAQNRGKVSSASSQRVDDYIEMIPLVEQDLQAIPAVLAFYQTLTPGYQKDWARYVYSAKQEPTKEKRRQEMIKVLAAGYKTRDLYRKENA
ncbi:YdeI/OmpD-associated family protein [Planococcus sp. YIM B11945]|uniref:YdeI/OmpD-associated family protein n=1 Tax=Planococcus sp. YIM B11945 TaxID=3435410 RepID=UPI003D7DAB71